MIGSALCFQGAFPARKHCVQVICNGQANTRKRLPNVSPTGNFGLVSILPKAKGNRGKRKSLLSLDDILIGNQAALKEGIVCFRSEHAEDISLAYLLMALVRAGKVKASVSYMTFHRAMEQFTGQHIGHDVPQKRYGELKEMSLTQRPREYSYRKAKDIIDCWTRIFAQIG